MSIQIYIARHASPDWSRKDIPYDIPPGPPLTPQGEAEARELGGFLESQSISKVYTSPLERAHRTAYLAAEVLGMTITSEEAIAEWRQGETTEAVAARLLPFWGILCEESRQNGPVVLVTHGGPLGLLLHTLGLPEEEQKAFTLRFDNHNPAPPAGLWSATQVEAAWDLDLVFMPGDGKRG